MYEIKTSEGSIEILYNNRVERTIPKGQQTVTESAELVQLAALGTAIKFHLPLTTKVDGDSFASLGELARKLGSFKKGGGDGQGVTMDELKGMLPIGVKNYVNDGSFLRGFHMWLSSVEGKPLAIVQDPRFGNTMMFESDSMGKGMYNRVIGSTMAIGEAYTYALWVKLHESNVADTSEVNIAYQGSFINNSEKFPISKEWKLVHLSQVYTDGNNNPRVYGIGKIQVAEVRITSGSLVSDFCLSIDDLIRPTFAYNSYKRPSKWTPENITVVEKSRNRIEASLIDETKVGNLYHPGFYNMGVSRVKVGFKTTGITIVSVWNMANEATPVNYGDIAEVKSEPGEPRRKIVTYTLPAGFDDYIDLLNWRDASFPAANKIVIESTSPTKTVEMYRASFYMTSVDLPWLPNIDDEEEWKYDISTRLSEVEGKVS